MTAAQIHRVEGIACYFGGLVLLYQLVQYVDRPPSHRPIRACFGGQAPSVPELVPLFWYLVITVAVPLANGAASGGKVFVEHTLFVVAVPLVLVALAACGRELVRAAHRPT